MKISLIAAMSENRVIGRDNKLPWHLPEDLKRFRRITTGHPVIMGRKTYESIGRLLPNRENLVLTRQPGYTAPGARVFLSLEETLDYCRKSYDEVFVIGGAEIYKQALPMADRIYLTRVHQQVEGDVFFPEFNAEEFKELAHEDHHGLVSYSFLIYERKACA